MEVVITEWALDSYIEHKKKANFTEKDYKTILKPDAEKLKKGDPFNPSDSDFSNSKFWGPATFKGKVIEFAYKMKWHNFGPGRIQFRLCIVIAETELKGEVKKRAFLLNAYVKDDKREKIQMARLKIKVQKIIEGTFKYRGLL